MKKWNRALTILLAAGLTAGLCGCESGADNPPSLPPDPASQAVEDVSTPEPTPTPTPEPTPEPTPTPEPEPHGLVLAEYKQGGYVNGTYVVHCLNPETGETAILSRFDNFEAPSDGSYQLGRSSMTSNMGWTLFSDDFSKIVCEKSLSSGGSCAGWIDTDGNFFDVTGALGLQRKSDFDDPVRCYPVGFSNGLFGFAMWESTALYTYYYVPVDNISPDAIQKGDVRAVGYPYDENEGLLKNSIGGRKYTPSDVTSWIDDTHCIVNDSHIKTGVGDWIDSVIVDTANQTVTKYVPGNSRSSWDGIISPDGKQIAFMSKQGIKASSSETDIYIIPINGGDPIKVPINSFSLGIMAPGVNYGLIGWI